MLNRPPIQDAYDTLSARMWVCSDLGRWEEAVTASTALLALDPPPPAARFVRGVAYRMQGKPAEAIADLEAFLASTGTEVRSHLGRLDSGEPTVTMLVPASSSGIAYAHYHLGCAREQVGDLAGARQAHDAALTLADENVPPAQRAEMHRARAFLLLRIADVSTALPDFEAACHLEPTNAALAGDLAVALAHLGRENESLAAHERATQLRPDDIALRFRYAVGLLEAGRVDAAVVQAEAAYQLAPTDRTVRDLLGDLLARQGHPESALAVAAREPALAPADVATVRMDVFFRVRRFEEAVAEADAVLRARPDEDRAQFTRAAALNNLGRFNEAADAYASLLALIDAGHPLASDDPARDPHDLDRAESADEVLSRLADSLVHAGRSADALAALERLRGLHPGDAQVANATAWLLATAADPALRDPARAAELARGALRDAPQNGDAWNTLGVALCGVRAWADALEALERSMDLHSGGNAYDWYFLALALWNQGRQEKARAWLEKADGWAEANAHDSTELARLRAEVVAAMAQGG